MWKISTITLASNSTIREEIFKLLHKVSLSRSPHNSASKLLVNPNPPCKPNHPVASFISHNTTTACYTRIAQRSPIHVQFSPAAWWLLPSNQLACSAIRSFRRRIAIHEFHCLVGYLNSQPWICWFPIENIVVPALPDMPNSKGI